MRDYMRDMYEKRVVVSFDIDIETYLYFRRTADEQGMSISHVYALALKFVRHNGEIDGETKLRTDNRRETKGNAPNVDAISISEGQDDSQIH